MTRHWRFALLLVPSALMAQDSTQPKVERKDSITVSSGLPKEQVGFEQACDARISEAESLLANGETAKAIEALDAAWAMTTSHDSLQSRRWQILRDRGRVYLQRREFAKSIEAFRNRLEDEQVECKNAADAVPNASTCAEAHIELGMAQVMSGENESGLRNLLQAAEYYRMCTKEGPETTELARISYEKFVAESTVMAAVAKARLGDREGAQNLL